MPKTFESCLLGDILKSVIAKLGNRGDEYLELFVVKHEHTL